MCMLFALEAAVDVMHATRYAVVHMLSPLLPPQDGWSAGCDVRGQIVGSTMHREMNAMDDEKPTAREQDRVARRAATAPPVERDVTERVVGRARLKATPVDTRSISAGAREMVIVGSDDQQRVDPDVESGWNVHGRMEPLDYLFGAVYLLLTARLLLALAGADATMHVVRVITVLTDPLCAPVRGLLRVPAPDAGQMLALPILIALVGYMLVHATISGLRRIARQWAPLA